MLCSQNHLLLLLSLESTMQAMSPSTLNIWNFRYTGGGRIPPHAYLTDPVNAPVSPAVPFVARGPINGSITKLFSKVLTVGSAVQFARVACRDQRKKPDGPGAPAEQEPRREKDSATHRNDFGSNQGYGRPGAHRQQHNSGW